MKNEPETPPTEDADDMRPEYDFSGGVRGKYADREALLAAIREIQLRYSEGARSDPRTPDEIIGYDEYGLPT
ncbi:MAG TPA: hypothetical protein VFJ82_02425 [Longimicrobium sp.]|nr:hypothetical protein [Longimicrobium sp.]